MLVIFLIKAFETCVSNEFTVGMNRLADFVCGQPIRPQAAKPPCGFKSATLYRHDLDYKLL